MYVGLAFVCNPEDLKVKTRQVDKLTCSAGCNDGFVRIDSKFCHLCGASIVTKIIDDSMDWIWDACPSGAIYALGPKEKSWVFIPRYEDIHEECLIIDEIKLPSVAEFMQEHADILKELLSKFNNVYVKAVCF